MRQQLFLIKSEYALKPKCLHNHVGQDALTCCMTLARADESIPDAVGEQFMTATDHSRHQGCSICSMSAYTTAAAGVRTRADNYTNKA